MHSEISNLYLAQVTTNRHEGRKDDEFDVPIVSI